MIEKALEKAKKFWESNPALINAEPLRIIAANDIKAGDAAELATAFVPAEVNGPPAQEDAPEE